MDKFTDMLSTIFVSSTVKEKKTMKDKKAAPPQFSSTHVVRLSSGTSSKADSGTESSSHENTETTTDESRENTSSFQTSDDVSSFLDSEPSSSDESESKSTSQSLVPSPVQSPPAVLSDSQHSDSSQSSGRFNLKRHILKASQFYKKNIIVVNNETADNVSIVSDLVHSLSLMRNVETLYQNTIHVITTAENKKRYKKMLLENPYLYFSNFDVRERLMPSSIKEMETDSKRSLYVVDYEKFLQMADYKQFLQNNVHVILVAVKTPLYIDEVYRALGDNSLLIHKRDKLKSLQKIFFKKIVKRLADNIDELSVDDYIEKVNSESFDGTYIILKGNELRYY